MQHRTHVKVIGATFQVVCDNCGPVGIEQDYRADAEAIADYHRKHGFTRPGYERSR